MTPRHAGLAAALSLLVPGLGQLYNHDLLRGLFWLIVTPGLWIGSGGLLGWVCHLIAGVHRAQASTDRQRARLKRRRTRPR